MYSNYSENKAASAAFLSSSIRLYRPIESQYEGLMARLPFRDRWRRNGKSSENPASTTAWLPYWEGFLFDVEAGVMQHWKATPGAANSTAPHSPHEQASTASSSPNVSNRQLPVESQTCYDGETAKASAEALQKFALPSPDASCRNSSKYSQCWNNDGAIAEISSKDLQQFCTDFELDWDISSTYWVTSDDPVDGNSNRGA